MVAVMNDLFLKFSLFLPSTSWFILLEITAERKCGHYFLNRKGPFCLRLSCELTKRNPQSIFVQLLWSKIWVMHYAVIFLRFPNGVIRISAISMIGVVYLLMLLHAMWYWQIVSLFLLWGYEFSAELTILHTLSMWRSNHSCELVFISSILKILSTLKSSFMWLFSVLEGAMKFIGDSTFLFYWFPRKVYYSVSVCLESQLRLQLLYSKDFFVLQCVE